MQVGTKFGLWNRKRSPWKMLPLQCAMKDPKDRSYGQVIQ